MLANCLGGISHTIEEAIDSVCSVFASNCSVVISGIDSAIGGEPIKECSDVGMVSAIGSKSCVGCAVIKSCGIVMDSSLEDGRGRAMNREGKQS